MGSRPVKSGGGSADASGPNGSEGDAGPSSAGGHWQPQDEPYTAQHQLKTHANLPCLHVTSPAKPSHSCHATACAQRLTRAHLS